MDELKIIYIREESFIYTEKLILYDSIYIKFLNMQNCSMVKNSKKWLPSGWDRD